MNLQAEKDGLNPEEKLPQMLAGNKFAQNVHCLNFESDYKK